jgi:2-succinyl-6-hydroxy-2,4-cyclohexadiene-1-carboxylate synthase
MDSMKLQILGTKSGPALVCLHGFLGTGADWLPFAEEFIRLRPDVQILLTDLPGHGESVSIPPENFVERLAAALDSAAIPRAALAGYSLGGRLALTAAIAQPQRFPTFIGISTTAGIKSPDERNARREADTALAKRLREDSFEEFLREWWSLPIFDSPKKMSSDEFLATRLTQNPAALSEVFEAWSPGVLPSLWNELPTYPGDALLLAGEADSKYSLLAHRMAESFRSAKPQILPGCGHRLLEEAPLELAHDVADFFPPNFRIGPSTPRR